MNSFKLSKQTRDYINNFSKINPGMVFHQGNVLKTLSNENDAAAFALIPETIPDRFAVGNLSKFLGVLNLYEPDADLFVDSEKTLVIQETNKKFVYTLSTGKSIPTSEKNEMELSFNIVAEFSLTAAEFHALKKNFFIGGFDTISFIFDGKGLIVRAYVVADPTSSNYEAFLGEISGRAFELNFEGNKILNMLEYDYTVTVTPNIIRFSSKEGVTYYNSPQLGSNIE